MGWSDQEFLAEVQRRFGFRLGRFLKVGRRVAYPLSLTRARRTSAGRCVIVGNAAQGLHPVAGMGFNLGLRDVASLAELVAEHCGDAGRAGTSAIARCCRVRCLARGGPPRHHRLHRRAGADVFQSRGAGAAAAQLGLLAFDLLPPAKAALSSLSTGAAGGSRSSRAAWRCACAGAAARTASASIMSRDFDVVIVGAGVIGTRHGEPAAGAQACESRQGGHRCRSPRTGPPARRRRRGLGLAVFALSRASQRLLQLCGVWQRSAGRSESSLTSACACGMPAARRKARDLSAFDCAEIGEPNLGFIVEGRALQECCLQRRAPRAPSSSRRPSRGRRERYAVRVSA